jgi:hypothetical protein
MVGIESVGVQSVVCSGVLEWAGSVSAGGAGGVAVSFDQPDVLLISREGQMRVSVGVICQGMFPCRAARQRRVV